MLLWNLYFLVKGFLHFTGKLQIDLGFNLALFFALVVTGIVVKRLHPLVQWVRHLAFAPIALALLLHELGLVVSSALLGQIQALSNFSTEYLLELTRRSIHPWVLWAVLAVFLLLRVFDRYLRTTAWVGTAMVLWGLGQIGNSWWQQHSLEPINNLQITARENVSPAELLALGKINFEELKALRNLQEKTKQHTIDNPTDSSKISHDTMLNTFFKEQKQWRLPSTKRQETTLDFDVVILQLCSISWADLQYSRQTQHPLLRNADFLFENFNTATSYSGPAAIRLLRGQCGQTEHKELYQAAPDACMAFTQLRHAGFAVEMGLNHDGLFDNFKTEVAKNIGEANTPVLHTDVNMGALSFDGTPLARDGDYLRRWWNKRQENPSPALAFYYNSITLHDGNRLPNSNQSSLSSYPIRLERLLNDIQLVLGDIQRSGRKALVVVVPEHGAGMTGEYGQLQGLRELPTPAITRVPVFGYWINGNSPANNTSEQTKAKNNTADRKVPVLVRQTTSYPALYTFIQRWVNMTSKERATPSWTALLADLPSTSFIAQQGNITIMEHQGKHWLKAPGINWKSLEPNKANPAATNNTPSIQP